MKKVFLIISLFWAIVAQAQLTFTSPVSYWSGVPVGAPSLKGSRIAANLLTNRLYQWDSTNLTWDLLSFGIDEISGISAPAYTPGIGDSPFAINKKTPNPELYYYFSGSWKLVGGGGGGTSYTAGEGIAIDGTVIRIDTLDRLSFNTLPTLPGGVGTFRWNDTDGTLDLGMKGGNVTLQVGQESLARVVNKSGTTINNGQVVYISGAQGNRIAVRIASASSDSTTNTVLGIATENIANNQEGYVTTEGLVRGLNTSAFPEGVPLYLSPTVPGGITATLPTAPNHEVIVGYCVRQHAAVGIIYANVQNGEGLNELHDVKLTSPANGQVLAYDSVNGWWENSAVGSVIDWPLLAPDGSAAAPSYAFSGGAGGMYATSKILGLQSLTGKKVKIAAANETTAAGNDIEIFSGTSTNATGGALSLFSGDGVSGGLFQLSGGDGTTDVGGAFTMTAGNSTNGAGGGFTASAGESISGQGGEFTLISGAGANAGGMYLSGGLGDVSGGPIYITSGAANGDAGSLNIIGADSNDYGNGGPVNIQGGGGIIAGIINVTGGTGQTGGPVNITSGNGSVNPAGDINIICGSGPTAPQNGKIVMTGNGVALPTLTTTQRNALTGVTAGTTIYCSNETANDASTGVVQTYNGSVWKKHW